MTTTNNDHVADLLATAKKARSLLTKRLFSDQVRHVYYSHGMTRMCES